MQATVHGVTKSQTQLSDFTFTLNILGIAFLWDWNQLYSHIKLKLRKGLRI